jgi:hypothetical protein
VAQKKKAGPTKMDGVKQAMASLGGDAKPLAIQKFMKDKLGVDISTGVISSYKKEFARRAAKARGKPAGAVVKGAAQVKPASAPAPAAAAPASKAGGKPAIPLDDILTVKALVGRLGAGPLKTLIDAFGG